MKGKNPFVELTEGVYETYKRVEKEIMNIYESMIDRAKDIEKWFATINLEGCNEVLDMEIRV